MFRETFRSKVHINRDKKFIHVSKAEKGGAVKTLDNKWYFHELSDGSTAVDFHMDVSLKATLLNMIVSNKMGRASEIIISSFERRATKLCDVVGDDTPAGQLMAEISTIRSI